MDFHYRGRLVGGQTTVVARWQPAVLHLRARRLSLHLGAAPRPVNQAPAGRAVRRVPFPYGAVESDERRAGSARTGGGAGQAGVQYGGAHRKYLDGEKITVLRLISAKRRFRAARVRPRGDNRAL